MIGSYCHPGEAAMSRRKKDPLRELTADERQALSRLRGYPESPSGPRIPAETGAHPFA